MCILWAILDHFGLLLVVLDGYVMLFVVVVGRWCFSQRNVPKTSFFEAQRTENSKKKLNLRSVKK